MKRGSSGAEVRILGDRAVKSHSGDPTRLVEQGLWLQRHRAPSLPHVFQVYARSYVMEKLVTAPAWALDHLAVFDALVENLGSDVWSRPADVRWDVDVTREKLSSLLDSFDLKSYTLAVFELFAQVDWTSTRRCLTHGDPTFDNVMFRESDDELVIVDPLPATPAIPDMLTVDTGKILQSIVGWERVRYHDPGQSFTVSPHRLRKLLRDENEWRATLFWCVVHLARTLPYVASDRLAAVKELIGDTVNMSRRL